MFPMLIAAGIGAAGSIASSLINNKAAAKAAKQQMEFQQRGVDTLEAHRSQILGDRDTALGWYKPAMSAGDDARGLMGGYLGLQGADKQQELFNNFQFDPGYGFMMDQGRKAIEGSRAASGLLKSGGTVRSLGDFGVNLSNQFFNQRMGYLNNLSGAGLTAANSAGGVNNGYLSALTGISTGISNIYGNMGTAAATGTINGANAISSGIQGVGNTTGYLLGSQQGQNAFNQQMNQYFPTTTGWTPSVSPAMGAS